jgi:hypothetical protein
MMSHGITLAILKDNIEFAHPCPTKPHFVVDRSCATALYISALFAARVFPVMSAVENKTKNETETKPRYATVF